MSETQAESGQPNYPDSLWHNASFVRLLIGRLVTNAGDSLYAVAAMWLVHELTGSTIFTGITEALLLLPLVLQFVSGPLVDRWPLVRSLVLIQLIQAVTILLLPIAAYTGQLNVALLLSVIPVLALLNQFVYPAQSAALPQIISNKQLSRGNSAFSFTNNGLDMLFEAIGGTLIALFGAVSLFLLDSVTFLLAAVLFSGVTVPGETTTSGDATEVLDVSGYLHDLREGVEAIRGSVFVQTTFTTAVSNFGIGMMFAVLPSFAALRSGPAFYGAMLGALGLGKALGAAIAPRLGHFRLGRVKILTFTASCLLWFGSIFTSRLSVAVTLFFLAWIPTSLTGVLSATLLQTEPPIDYSDELRPLRGVQQRCHFQSVR